MKRFDKVIGNYNNTVKNVLAENNMASMVNKYKLVVENGKVVNRGKFNLGLDNDIYKVVLSYVYVDQCIDLNGYPRYAYVCDLFFTIYKGVGSLYYRNYLTRKRLCLEGQGSAMDKFANSFAYIMCSKTNVEPVQMGLSSLINNYGITESNIDKVQAIIGK